MGSFIIPARWLKVIHDFPDHLLICRCFAVVCADVSCTLCRRPQKTVGATPYGAGKPMGSRRGWALQRRRPACCASNRRTRRASCCRVSCTMTPQLNASSSVLEWRRSGAGWAAEERGPFRSSGWRAGCSTTCSDVRRGVVAVAEGLSLSRRCLDGVLLRNQWVWEAGVNHTAS